MSFSDRTRRCTCNVEDVRETNERQGLFVAASALCEQKTVLLAKKGCGENSVFFEFSPCASGPSVSTQVGHCASSWPEAIGSRCVLLWNWGD